MKKIMITAICLLIGSAFATISCAQKQTPPVGGIPKDFKLPEKKIKEFPNGLRSSLIQYGAVPKADVKLIIKTGNVHEASNEVWLADLTGLLIKEGTTTKSFKEISKKVASMGGNIDVSTGMDNVTISGSVLSEFVPELVKVIADIVVNPAMPASEIDRLKADLKRQLMVQRSEPQSQATEKFFQMVYQDHPYGRYFPTEEMINNYTVEKVKGFYEINFGARRSVIYVVGKFDEAAVNKAIEESLSTWKAGPEVSFPPATPVRTNEISMIDRKDAPQTTIIIGLPTLIPKDKDYVALQVTNSLLGGSFGSRITSNIREDKGYTYSPFSTIQNRKGVSVWYEQADVTSEHTGESLREISKEVKRMQTEAPPQNELEGIQRYMAGTFVLQNSNTSGIISQLNFIDLHGLDESYLTDRVKNLYAVTPEKVRQITKDYFKYEDMTLVLVGDKKQLDKQIKMHKDAQKVK